MMGEESGKPTLREKERERERRRERQRERERERQRDRETERQRQRQRQRQRDREQFIYFICMSTLPLSSDTPEESSAQCYWHCKNKPCPKL
jgi:hypothetical protein